MNKINTNIIDEETLDMILQVGGDKLLEELIEIFLTDAAEKIEEGRHAIEYDDFDTAERSFHSLVSMSGNLGAISMMDLARHLEELASMKNKEKMRPGISEFDTVFANVKMGLNKLII